MEDLSLFIQRIRDISQLSIFHEYQLEAFNSKSSPLFKKKIEIN